MRHFLIYMIHLYIFFDHCNLRVNNLGDTFNIQGIPVSLVFSSPLSWYSFVPATIGMYVTYSCSNIPHIFQIKMKYPGRFLNCVLYWTILCIYVPTETSSINFEYICVVIYYIIGCFTYMTVCVLFVLHF